ncbi:hypothetical protein BDA99DRAFT_425746, partial [Phascolomyces articulosus]
MYNNWDCKMDIITNHLRWYRTADLITFVHQVCEFVIRSIGRMSEAYAPNLIQSECPARPNVRFPQNDLYICEGVGGWSYRINTLLLALSIVLHPNKLHRGYPEVETPGDAEMALLASAADVIGSIERLQDIIDRNTFEQRYEIQWIDLS